MRRLRQAIFPIVLLVALVAVPATSLAQDHPFPLDYRSQGVTYSDQLPTPSEVVGHRIGTSHTRPHQLVAYFEALADASDRVAVERHASSYEGRPLIHAIVTSPANHARLEEIRRQHLRLSDDPASVGDAELAGMPAVVYMGYSVHGNEASGSEAAVLLLYHLAAGNGPAVEALLDSTVVIVDPSLNPDGRDRFVDWANGQRGAEPTSDNQDREHIEPWPGGRTNHYWFDLNRDWLPAQHPESRGRLQLFHRWRPQLLTDFHEMGGDATYFFQPGIPSRNNPNSPEAVFALTARLAEYHASGLDEVGSLYYSEESFDDFYYGKGSTYPDVNGAVGILFEQASSRALERETVHGQLTYERTILNQFVTSLTTLAGLRDMRLEFLQLQRDFYRDAPAVARSLGTKAFVVSLANRTRAQAMAATLQRHRVQVYRLSQPIEVDGRRFEPGEAYVIPTDQPQVRFLVAAMERVTTFRDSLFYDVSTWSFPLAFGVEVSEYGSDPASFLGEVLAPIEFDGGAVRGGPARYAYVMKWDRYFAPRALHRILAAGVHPLVARKPFSADVAGLTTAFDRGSVIIPLQARDWEAGPTPDDIHALVNRMAEEDHVLIHAVNTGLTPSGPDLGGSSSSTLSLPQVALMAGSGQSAYEVGEIWHLLSYRMGVPVSLVDADRLDRIDLARYNRLIVVTGFAPDSATVAERLGKWVEDGGVLIAQRGAAGSLLRLGLIDENRREAEQDSTTDITYAAASPTRGAQAIGGAAFEVVVDTTHPLAFGYGPTAVLFRRGTLFLDPSTTPGANVARYAEAPLASGYIADRPLSLLRGSASIIGRRKGRGAVILLMDSLTFRAFWYGSSGFLTNAVFFGGSF